MDDKTLQTIDRIRQHYLFGSIFCQYHPTYFTEFKGPITLMDTSHDLSAVKENVRVKLGTFKHSDQAGYLQDCANAVPALLEEIERLKKLIPEEPARQP